MWADQGSHSAQAAVRALRCPLGCGALVPRERVRENRFGLTVANRIGWCTDCGIGATLDPPGHAELNRLYEEAYTAGDQLERVGCVPREGIAARLWRRLNGTVPLVDADLAEPVLDVGSHTGELLEFFRRRGIQAVGVEPNPRAVAVARERGLSVIAAAIEVAELPEARFGSVILSHVLEHLYEPEQVLQRLRPALRKDGRLHLVVPNADSIFRRLFGENWIHWHVPFHLWHFSSQSLERLLTRVGFRIEHLCTYTAGEWLMLSAAARRARFSSVVHVRRAFGRRLLLAAPGRVADHIGRGDALYVVARSMAP